MDIYEAAYENAPDPILVVDARGVILRANGEAEKAFQYARHELEGQVVEILIPDRFAATHPHHRQGYMSSALTKHMGTARNLTAKRRDGSEFPIDIMLSTADTGDGPVAIAIVQDITESRKNQAVLRDALERVRLSSEAASMGYWTFDEESGAYWCDSVCARHFGGRPEDFRDHASVDARILPEDRDDRWRKSLASLEAHGVYESEFRVSRPDGSTRWLRDLGRWVDHLPEGKGRQLAGVTYDISVRKHSEALQAELVASLRSALREVKVLKGLLPICSHCKKIRDDSGNWQQLESYIHQRTDADFSHGICPQCAQKYYAEYLSAEDPSSADIGFGRAVPRQRPDTGPIRPGRPQILGALAPEWL